MLKLAVMPVVAWLVGVGARAGRDRVLLGVVITAALPTAQNIFLHATRYRVGEDVARESILVTTLCLAAGGAARRRRCSAEHRPGEP